MERYGTWEEEVSEAHPLYCVQPAVMHYAPYRRQELPCTLIHVPKKELLGRPTLASQALQPHRCDISPKYIASLLAHAASLCGPCFARRLPSLVSYVHVRSSCKLRWRESRLPHPLLCTSDLSRNGLVPLTELSILSRDHGAISKDYQAPLRRT